MEQFTVTEYGENETRAASPTARSTGKRTRQPAGARTPKNEQPAPPETAEPDPIETAIIKVQTVLNEVQDVLDIRSWNHTLDTGTKVLALAIIDVQKDAEGNFYAVPHVGPD